MKQSRFTETQIVTILREADAGVAVTEVCRKYGISGNTFYNWKKKYSGMGVPELKRMKELETENTRLKRMYSELSLENHALKELISKSSNATRTPGSSGVPGGGTGHDGEYFVRTCRPVEIGLVQACPGLAGVRQGAYRGIAEAGGALQPLGLLEVLWPTSSRRPSVESQAGSPGVPGTRPEHEAEDEEEDTHQGSVANDSAGRAQRDLVSGLHA